MKITKTNKDVMRMNNRKLIANEGCHICPCCDETERLYFDSENGTKGIVDGIIKTWHEGFFKTRHMRVDCYVCYTCGAEWESEPYQCEDY